jgi:nitrogen fixation NifU-like protein
MYSDRLLEHFKNPRNAGDLPDATVVFRVENPACGDTLRLAVRMDGDRIGEARFQTRGCTASIAAASALTAWLTGKTKADLAQFRTGVVEDEIGPLPAASQHAAVLCADAVRELARALG